MGLSTQSARLRRQQHPPAYQRKARLHLSHVFFFARFFVMAVTSAGRCSSHTFPFTIVFVRYNYWGCTHPLSAMICSVHRSGTAWRYPLTWRNCLCAIRLLIRSPLPHSALPTTLSLRLFREAQFAPESSSECAGFAHHGVDSAEDTGGSDWSAHSSHCGGGTCRLRAVRAW